LCHYQRWRRPVFPMMIVKPDETPAVHKLLPQKITELRFAYSRKS
jgi:hypothetical protein